MLTESQFQSLTATTLARLHDALEPAYDSGALEELDLQTGILTIITESGKTFVVSAHGPSKEMWLASPLSGGLHFIWDGSQWSKNGETLDFVLSRDLGVSL